MTESANPHGSFDTPPIGKEHVVSFDSQVSEQEQGLWHIIGDGLDASVICHDRVLIDGVVGDYIFGITNKGKFAQTKFCHDKDIPQGELHYSADKMGNMLKIEIFSSRYSHKFLIQKILIRWPMPNVEPFVRIVEDGMLVTTGGKKDKNHGRAVKVDDGQGGSERVLLFSQVLHHWVPAPEHTTVEILKKTSYDRLDAVEREKRRRLTSC